VAQHHRKIRKILEERMKEKILIFALLIALLPGVVRAQEPVTAQTLANLNVRTGPGMQYAQVGTADIGSQVVLEGRSENAIWVLAHTPDNALRGWMAAEYLALDGTQSIVALPVTTELIDGGRMAEGPVRELKNGPDSPVIPEISETARKIYLYGQTVMDNDPHAFSYIGDCASEGEQFLNPIVSGNFHFGRRGEEYYQPVIEHFEGFFTHESQAAVGSLNALSLLSPLAANPWLCEEGDTILACEYDLVKPSVMLIMLGTNDAGMSFPAEFETRMRLIIEYLINRGVIPVLSTIPNQQPKYSMRMTVRQVNVILERLAKEYDIPLWNYWKAVEPLDNHGLAGDNTHISPEGFWMRNLTALQMLDAVWREAMGGGEGTTPEATE
jgi:hypothetical protein